MRTDNWLVYEALQNERARRVVGSDDDDHENDSDNKNENDDKAKRGNQQQQRRSDTNSLSVSLSQQSQQQQRWPAPSLSLAERALLLGERCLYVRARVGIHNLRSTQQHKNSRFRILALARSFVLEFFRFVFYYNIH